MKTEELSDYLGVPKRTLENWRTTGEGPPFFRLTARKVRYLKDDVTNWLAQRRYRHTAEVAR